MILFVLILLIGTMSGSLSLAEAASLPINAGAQSWEYSEFTKAFNQYLHTTNPAPGYLFLALGLGLVIVLVLELFRRQRESRKESQPRSSTVTTATGTSQRRAWARVQSSLDCSFVIDHSPQSPPDKTNTAPAVIKEEELRGLIVDLSGGGCKITTPYELQIGDKLELFLELGSRRKTALKGEVVRTEQEPDSEQTFAGVMFLDIREAIRDQIISWMFKHQQNILEGQRRLAEGLCLRCGKPLTEGMRQQTIFCSKCNRIQRLGSRNPQSLSSGK